MPRDFYERLVQALPKLLEVFPTPFHVYDEIGIRATARRLKTAFAGCPGFREFFAVKALPNPAIMEIMKEEGFGFDCSSVPELVLARAVGALSDDIMFTSNNTSAKEYMAAMFDTPVCDWSNGSMALRPGSSGKAANSGCILNLDDITFIPKAAEALGGRLPELIVFRYNPGKRRQGVNQIIGDPVNQKYGVPHEQLVEAFRLAREYGAKRFGLHCMIASNQRDYRYIVATVKMLLEAAEMVGQELGIRFKFINIGGGIGIPYKPGQREFNLEALAKGAKRLLADFERAHGYQPKLFMECGRYMTGPHGVLVTRVINKMMKYKLYYGVDASASACPRPFIYDAYHGLIVPRLEGKHVRRVRADVVGSLCENADKFAHDRLIAPAEEGDIMLLENTGAHSWAMGSTYNARLRVPEVLLRDESARLIRRGETMSDYFATLNFDPITVRLQ